MAKGKKKEPEVVDMYVGADPEDDLMDMEYIQNEDTPPVDTHPPETKEEADELLGAEEAKAKKLQEEVEEELTDEKAKEDEQPEAEAEEPAEEAAVLEDEPSIPKPRFDEINERMKKAEAKVESLEGQLERVVEEKTPEPEPEPYDYKTKEKEAMDALLEGDADKYSAINEEIRQAEKAEYVREAKKLADVGDQNLRENMTFEETGARIEHEFPQFSADSEVYDADAREEMLDLYVGYAQSGRYTKTQALQRAADKAAKLYGFTDVAPEPAPDLTNIVDIKKTDPKAKAKAANEQPPAMESRAQGTNEEPRRDYKSMSDEEFDALPESTKKRARGDVL